MSATDGMVGQAQERGSQLLELLNISHTALTQDLKRARSCPTRVEAARKPTQACVRDDCNV
jgi:hypothetical protein